MIVREGCSVQYKGGNTLKITEKISISGTLHFLGGKFGILYQKTFFMTKWELNSYM